MTAVYGGFKIRIYEEKYPETRQGGDRKSEEAESKRNNFALKPTFTEDTAGKFGVSQRTVQQEVSISEAK